MLNGESKFFSCGVWRIAAAFGHRSGLHLPSLISQHANSAYVLFAEMCCSSLWRRCLRAHKYIIFAIHPAARGLCPLPCRVRSEAVKLCRGLPLTGDGRRTSACGKRQMRRYAQIVSCCGGTNEPLHNTTGTRCVWRSEMSERIRPCANGDRGGKQYTLLPPRHPPCDIIYFL